jgi:hypothetical protein
MNTNKKRFFIKFNWLFLILCLSVSAYAQQTQLKSELPANVENHKLDRLPQIRMKFRLAHV